MRGGYETILIIAVAVISTFLVSGLPFGRLPVITVPGEIVQQVVKVPDASTKQSINLNTIDIQTTFAPAGNCTPPTGGDISSLLTSRYHITFASDSTDQATVLRQQRIAYKTLCLLNKSSTYGNLLGAATVYFVSAPFSWGNGVSNCGLGISGGPHALSNYCSDQSAYCSAIGWCPDYPMASMFVMAHELGHLILDKNVNNVFTNYENTIFTHEKLPTQNCVSPAGGGTPVNECFADMNGEYLTYTMYKHNASLFNHSINFLEYPSAYAATYNYAKTYIFNGIEYSAQDIDLTGL